MIRKLLIPSLVILASIFGAVTLMATAPKLIPSAIEPIATTVRVVVVDPQPVQLSVRSQGTVVPNAESELIPEVSGRVVWMYLNPSSTIPSNELPLYLVAHILSLYSFLSAPKLAVPVSTGARSCPCRFAGAAIPSRPQIVGMISTIPTSPLILCGEAASGSLMTKGTFMAPW